MISVDVIEQLVEEFADRVATRLLERLGRAPAEPDDPWIPLPKPPKKGTGIAPVVCGVGTRRILEAGRRGEIQLGRVGRTPAIRRSELDRWIASRPVEVPRTRRPQQPEAADDDAQVIELAAQRLSRRGAR